MNTTTNMHEPTTSRTYDLWSKFYDYTFGSLVRKRQRRAVEELKAVAGELVLDLGVGTGMTLSSYPKGVEVVGMDLTGGMLQKAARKKEQLGLKHCALVQGDGMQPPLAESSFDRVLITHTVSVVSDPPKLMNWAEKLVKPGGRIVVLNHFKSDNKVMAFLETIFNPMFIKIGWKSDLSLEHSLHSCGLKLLYQYKMARIDLWKIVVLQREQADG